MTAPDAPVQILLVESDLEHVEHVCRACSESGSPVRISIAATAEEAMDRMLDSDERPRKPLPDLLLIDCDLPDIGGIDLLSILKRTESLPSIPAYIMTCSADYEPVEDAFFVGVAGYWSKPIGTRALSDAIELARLGRG